MTIYEHKNKQGGKYPHDDTYVIESITRMKSPESGEWYDAVLYRSTTKEEIFCREQNDFFDNFKVKEERMTLLKYQEQALETTIYPEEHKIIYPALGIAGEAGEVAEKVKKVLRDKDGKFNVTDELEIFKELGDVLWYINALARDLGYTLEEVARKNIEKLASRKERGKIHGNGDNR